MALDRTWYNTLVNDLGDNLSGTLWDKGAVDSLMDAVDAALEAANINTNDFLLTLESGVPVSTTDQLAKTTLYATPSGSGNRIALFDAAGAPTIRTSAQFSIALPSVANQVYGVFAYSNAGVPTLELTAWTNDTTPGPAAFVLTTTGVWTKTGDLTRRYLGAVRTTTVAGQTEDSVIKRFVANVARRPARPLRVLPTTDTWPYTTNTWRQANADTANQAAVVVAVPGALLNLELAAIVSGNGTGATAYVSIGEDSTTTPATGVRMNPVWVFTTSGAYVNPTARLVKYPAVGYHFYTWLEKSTVSGVQTWRGDGAASDEQSGLVGWIDG